MLTGEAPLVRWLVITATCLPLKRSRRVTCTSAQRRARFVGRSLVNVHAPPLRAYCPTKVPKRECVGVGAPPSSAEPSAHPPRERLRRWWPARAP